MFTEDEKEQFGIQIMEIGEYFYNAVVEDSEINPEN